MLQPLVLASVGPAKLAASTVQTAKSKPAMIDSIKASIIGALGALSIGVSSSHSMVAAAPELWHGAVVGMSIADVQQLYPAAHRVPHPMVIKDGWVEALQIDAAVIDGRRELVSFSFKDGGLINVVTRSGGRTDPDAVTGAQVQQVLDGLKAKYGQPACCTGPDENLLLACFWHEHGMLRAYMGRTTPLPLVLEFNHVWLSTDQNLLK